MAPGRREGRMAAALRCLETRKLLRASGVTRPPIPLAGSLDDVEAMHPLRRPDSAAPQETHPPRRRADVHGPKVDEAHGPAA